MPVWTQQPRPGSTGRTVQLSSGLPRFRETDGSERAKIFGFDCMRHEDLSTVAGQRCTALDVRAQS